MGSRNAKGRMIYWKISYCKQLARCSTFAKLLFTWLIPNTDDLGRMEGDPEIIKGMVFPYDEKITIKQIKEALEDLTREELITWYQIDENYYIQFPKFFLYQNLRKDRDYKSDYPSPSDIDMTCHDMSRHDGQNLREEKGSEEKRSEGEGKEKIPYSLIQESFNRLCPSFPKIEKMSDKRKDKLRKRWEEVEALEKFEEIFRLMENSDFLKGKNQRGWQATFDWVIDNDNNWVKVAEGQYANKGVKLDGPNRTDGIPQTKASTRYPVSNFLDDV